MSCSHNVLWHTYTTNFIFSLKKQENKFSTFFLHFNKFAWIFLLPPPSRPLLLLLKIAKFTHTSKISGDIRLHLLFDILCIGVRWVLHTYLHVPVCMPICKYVYILLQLAVSIVSLLVVALTVLPAHRDAIHYEWEYLQLWAFRRALKRTHATSIKCL